MHDNNHDLLRLKRKDLYPAAAVLGRAFTEYDLLRYFYPDHKQRSAIAESFVCTALAVCFKYGEVYASSEKMEGVSAWLPPGKALFGQLQILRAVPLPVLFRFGRWGGMRMQSYGKHVDNLHRTLVTYPHWYLQIIGVDPPYQGQGFASKVINPMLERIDHEGMPCFLETEVEKNVAIYKRFGFEVISGEKAPGTEITNYAMLRKPSER